MPRYKKRDLLDPNRFAAELAELTLAPPHVSPSDKPSPADKSEPRQPSVPLDDKAWAEVLKLFRSHLDIGRAKLRELHEKKGASGKQIVRGHTHVADTLLRALYDLVQQQDALMDLQGGSAPAKGEQTGHPQTDGPGGMPRKQPLLHRVGAHIKNRLRERKQRRRKRKNLTSPAFTLVATGGYGRAELAPHSDIDLLFLLPTGVYPELGRQIERMLYFLWDLGLDVGHAVRTIDECVQMAESDLEIRTSMLESRLLAGDQKLYKQYRSTLFDKVLLHDVDGFLRDKIQEQSKRHERFGNSLFYLEPNIKENPGGLRDIHTFFWISKYRYRVKKVKELIPMGVITDEEYHTFIRCRQFLWRVRNGLHYMVGRRDDRLTFTHQVDLAKSLGYKDRPGLLGVEIFMRRYYKVARQVESLSQIFLQKYQEECRPGESRTTEHLEDVFDLVGDKIFVNHQDAFTESPIRLLKLFRIAQRHVKDIHPETMRLVTAHLNLINKKFRSDPEVNKVFLSMLSGKRAVAWVLHRMNTCGVLGRFIPEFGRITGQSQHDLFHVFTVDEHSIRALEAVRDIRMGKFSKELPLSTELIGSVKDLKVLYLAVLLHDIAKGRGGQHAEKGARIAEVICPRLGLNEKDTEMVSWLVRSHLIFSRTAFRRDLNDPETVNRFAEEIGTEEKLNLLLLLTVADIRAVGPGVWNDWKATLMRRLHGLTRNVLNEGSLSQTSYAALAAEQQEEVEHILTNQGEDPDRVKAHLNRFYPDYFMAYEMKELISQYRDLAASADDSLAITLHPHPDSDTTRLLIHTPDHSGLIAEISGALAAESVNILFANGHITRDGMALEMFTIQDSQGHMIDNARKFNRIEKTLRDVLTRKVSIEKLLARVQTSTSSLAKRHQTFEVPISVEWDNEFSKSCTVLEISTKDRLGLLHVITRTLQMERITIRTAKITTYGERAVDVFYVKDLFGIKLLAERASEVANALKKALEQFSESGQNDTTRAKPARIPKNVATPSDPQS